MIATFVNCGAVLLGSIIGCFFSTKINEEFKNTVYTSVGIFTLIIGMSMALQSQRVLFLPLALLVGGLIGNVMDVEGKIYSFGEFLKKRFAGGNSENSRNFSHGFLNASILFCVGAMALVGSFKAGTEGDYSLIFIKSVMDGFVAILMSSVMGIGVAFSVITILLYQGCITILAGLIKPWVSPLMLTELTALGGALVLMIGFNLLQLKQIKTGNFIISIFVMVLLVLLVPENFLQ